MDRMSPQHSPFSHLPAFDEESGDVNIVIKTPKGKRNKFEFDHERAVQAGWDAACCGGFSV